MAFQIDYAKFWKTNAASLQNFQQAEQVPVDLPLPGDWICELLGLDNVKYYSDYRYQQESQLKAGELTKRHLGCEILPAIDFGVILEASIYGGKVHYESNATPTLEPVVQDPGDIDQLVETMDQKKDLLECGLVPLFLEWREKLFRDYSIQVVYGDSLKGCATMMGQICGLTNFLTWIATDPEQIHKLIDCWFRTSQRYLEAMRKATDFPKNKKGFYFYSDVSEMLSPRMYDEFIKEYEKGIYDRYAPGSEDVRYYHADYHMLHHLNPGTPFEHLQAVLYAAETYGYIYGS
ncbi:MAG: uroporphyrinogen decarboxylase family protein [Spirochaetales bacterium]